MAKKKRSYIYPTTGLPFNGPAIVMNLDHQIDRVKRKKASLIIVSGGIGEGKTTFAVHLADYITKTEINFKDIICIGGDNFKANLIRIAQEETKTNKVIIYDEAGDFSKRGALTSFNQMINRIFELYRGFKIIVIMVLPDFNVLDNQLFANKIPQQLYYCHGRKETYGNYKGYSLNKMYKLKEWTKKKNNPHKPYKLVSPNIYGHFKDLSPLRSKKLDIFSTTGKIDILNDKKLEKGFYSISQLAVKINKSESYTYTLLRRNEIKPAKKEGRLGVYDSNALKLLRMGDV